MRNSTICKMYIATILSFVSPQAIASSGGMEGGGGKSVVCRDAQGNINSAETLDLWEAKNIYSLQPKTFNHTLDRAISELRTDLKNTIVQPEIHLFPLLDRVQKIMKLIPSSVVLKPIDDSAEVALPKGCNLEQLAHYVDDELLLVSDEIWNALSVTDKAALIAHEAIYRMERSYGATDSRRTRKIVGHLFSGFPFEKTDSDIPLKAEKCTATQGDRVTFQFDYYPVSTGKTMTALQFYLFEGKHVFSKKTVILPITSPWINSVPENCFSSSRCNFTAGDTNSRFEGNDSITLGLEQQVSNGVIEMKFYFLSTTGRHYLNCFP